MSEERFGEMEIELDMIPRNIEVISEVRKGGKCLQTLKSRQTFYNFGEKQSPVGVIAFLKIEIRPKHGICTTQQPSRKFQ